MALSQRNLNQRLQLQRVLEDSLGSSNVYFQPPSAITLKYPCIIYKLDDIEDVRANDKRYLNHKRYLITIVDRNPDSSTPDKILDLPYCTFENYFVIDNLNHYNCSLYY